MDGGQDIPGQEPTLSSSNGARSILGMGHFNKSGSKQDDGIPGRLSGSTSPWGWEVTHPSQQEVR